MKSGALSGIGTLVVVLAVVITTTWLFGFFYEDVSTGKSDLKKKSEFPSDVPHFQSKRDSKKPERLPVTPIGMAQDTPEDPEEKPVIEPDKGSAHKFLVQGEDGYALADAEVRLFRRPYGDPIEKAVTGTTGEAELFLQNPGDEIEAEAEDFTPARFSLRDRPWPDPLPIVLKKGKVIFNGMVLNEIDHPVDGARVTLYFSQGCAHGKTDDKGLFKLHFGGTLKSPLKAKFQIFHPSYCFLGGGVPVLVDLDQENFCLKVHRWSRLCVEAVDLEGRPMPTTRFYLAGPPEAPNRKHLPGGVDAVIGFLQGGSGKGETGSEERKTLNDKVPPKIPLWLIAEHPFYRSMEIEIGCG